MTDRIDGAEVRRLIGEARLRLREAMEVAPGTVRRVLRRIEEQLSHTQINHPGLAPIKRERQVT